MEDTKQVVETKQTFGGKVIGWIKKNRKKIIVTGLTIAGIAVLSALGKSGNDDEDIQTDSMDLIEEGGDCETSFVKEETEEN